MFWATDVNGRLIGTARSWSANERRSQVVAAVQALLKSVLLSRDWASTQSRVAQLDGRPGCIRLDASPALSPDDGSFVGFLGSVRVVPEGVTLSDWVEADEALARVILLDAVAERVIEARDLAVRAKDRRVAKALDLALLTIGDRLAEAGRPDAQ